MNILAIIGALLIAAPFVLLFAFMVRHLGWLHATGLAIAVIALMLLVRLGVEYLVMR